MVGEIDKSGGSWVNLVGNKWIAGAENERWKFCGEIDKCNYSKYLNIFITICNNFVTFIQ